MTDTTQSVPAGSVLYIQLHTGMAFIGKLQHGDDDSEILLDDCLQVISVPVPVQTPQGMAMRLQPMLGPIHHLATGPEQKAVPTELVSELIHADSRHPLVDAYTKQTSRITLPPSGFKLQGV